MQIIRLTLLSHFLKDNSSDETKIKYQKHTENGASSHELRGNASRQDIHSSSCLYGYCYNCPFCNAHPSAPWGCCAEYDMAGSWSWRDESLVVCFTRTRCIESKKIIHWSDNMSICRTVTILMGIASLVFYLLTSKITVVCLNFPIPPYFISTSLTRWSILAKTPPHLTRLTYINHLLLRILRHGNRRRRRLLP